MTGGPEYVEVEEPFLTQLAGLGWKLVNRARELSRGSDPRRPGSGVAPDQSPSG